MNTLRLNIVTPNGSVYEREDVEMAVLQTTAGEMGPNLLVKSMLKELN